MSLEIQWTGTDGSVWDLRRGSVRITRAGIQGLSMPVPMDFLQENALLDGQRFTGWRLKPRTVFLPLWFKFTASRDPEGLQRAFWRSVKIGKYGVLRVTDESGAYREISLRFQDDGGWAMTLDPYVGADHPVGITMVADQPWWEGPAQIAFYSFATSAQTFYGNGAGATPFYIAPATTGDTIVISNPGDEPAWPVWVFDGEITSFDVAVDGHHVAAEIIVDAAHRQIVETDPLRQLAQLGLIDPTNPIGITAGVINTRLFSAVDFAPVPDGGTATVAITVSGTGVAKSVIRPRYSRAY